MDSDGVIVDSDRAPHDVSDVETIKMYKNMLSGTKMSCISRSYWLITLDSKHNGSSHV